MSMACLRLHRRLLGGSVLAGGVWALARIPLPRPPPAPESSRHGCIFIFLEHGTDIPDLKRLQLSSRSDHIVLCQQRGQDLRGLHIRGLHICLRGLHNCLLEHRTCLSGSQMEAWTLFDQKYAEGGRRKVKLSSIRPAAMEQIKKYSKLQFIITHFNIILPITKCN